MPSSRWNYVDVNCLTCTKKGTIRIDQYNRKNNQWICRSCTVTGRKLKVKNPSPRHDTLKVGAYKSYWRAKKRVRENHRGAYSHVEFKFTCFQEFYDEVGPRPEGKTIDRIDPWGNYEVGNVRWATHVEQCNNKRKTKS
jgi:hypothetical protein